jgi:hypothetical protein
MEQPFIHDPSRHLWSGGQGWLTEHRSGILTHPWVAVGTPANPEGQLQTSFLFFDTQSELGPHAFPIEHGSLHFPL